MEDEEYLYSEIDENGNFPKLDEARKEKEKIIHEKEINDLLRREYEYEEQNLNDYETRYLIEKGFY